MQIYLIDQPHLNIIAFHNLQTLHVIKSQGHEHIWREATESLSAKQLTIKHKKLAPTLM